MRVRWWLLGGLALVVMLGVIRLGPRRAGEKTSNRARGTESPPSRPTAAAAPAPDARSVPPSGAAATAETGRTPSRRRVFNQSLPVVAEREETPDTSGRFNRLTLVESPGRLGRLRVQDRIVRAGAGGTETLLSTEVHVAGEVLVSPAPGVSAAGLEALLASVGAVAVTSVYGSGSVVARFPLPDLDTLPRVLAELARRPDVVRAAEANGVGTGGFGPNDTSFLQQYALRNTGQTFGVAGADIRMTAAWDQLTESPAVIVAVLDSGIDFTHPDLAPNVFRDTVEIAGNGTDEDANGFVDDYRGWDFVNNDNDPSDDLGHGSHVSGTIGAKGNNSQGIAGVTWAVRLLPVKILDSSNFGSTANLIAGTHYARVKGARLMNLSLINYPYSATMQSAVAAAESAGILLVTAAGNNGGNNDLVPLYPSSYANLNILAVANTTDRDVLNTGYNPSNYGATSVDLAAPGTSILSTVAGGNYEYYTGTSMSVPHVVGVAALLLALRPTATVSDLRRWILDSADRLPALSGRCATGGRLNASAALLAATLPPAIGSPPQGRTVIQGSSTTFTVAATGSPTLTYQWSKSGVAIANATAATFVLANVQAAHAGSYSVLVTNRAGSVTSVAAELVVLLPPTLVTSPAGQTVAAGQPLIWTVAADGTAPLTYQWRKDGVALPGATAAALALAAVAPADAGSYTVVVANAAGAVTSGAAVLVVATPPAVTVPPASLAVAAGQNAAFAVTASGTPPLAYQWRKGGTTLPGATNSTLALTGVQASDAGSYTVVITNALGSATSAAAALLVNPGPSPAGGTQALVGNGYLLGGTVTVTNTLTHTGTVTSLTWQVLLPAGWSYAGGTGNDGNVRPAVGATELAEWTWTTVPPSPVNFTYTLNVPGTGAGTQTLAALVVARQSGNTFQTLAQPDPLAVGQLHSADSNRDGRISLLELTRVIEVYNTRNGTTRTGCYAVDAAGEDGFAPDSIRAASVVITLGRYHSGDANRDGKLSLLELTRMIELYNTRAGTTRTGQYHAQAGTEDGFAAGP